MAKTIAHVLSRLRSKKRIKTVLYFSECAALFFYIFSLPSFSGRYPLNYVSYAFMALLILVTFINLLLYFKPFIRLYLLIIPLFVFWAFLGTTLFSHDFRGWFSIVLLSITMFVFYYAFYIIKNYKLIMLIIILSLFSFCFYFLIIYWKDILDFRSFTGESFRLGGYFDNVNQIASYMSLGISLSLFFILFEKRKIYLILLIPVLVFGGIGLTTGSKKFIIISVITLLVVFFIKFRHHKLLFTISLISIVASVVILLSLPFMSPITKRLLDSFATLLGDGDSTSTIQRYLWQQYACQLGFKQAIFGYGYNGFSLVSGVGTYSHANYSEIICNFGIIGFLFFYWPHCLILFKSLKKANYISKFNFVFLSMFIVYSFTKVYFFDKDYYLILAFIFFVLDSTTDSPQFRVKKNKKFRVNQRIEVDI